ncbi:MAG: SRPBCC domain-containing protein [Gammaproteobacteria bacterium]|nr:SRPBCC domain-containing protein [Gammaproteobacteria bacterium]NND40218.1 SRPBCC domain-containing protein [Pseudomonadales bacterium]NNM11312.1 SRPBCC domain-containing protein [Pseudomonadales bacterium]RZV56164.1 MAG: SRPBCC domain-containing protein [Pseudomonadales bacterium]
MITESAVSSDPIIINAPVEVVWDIIVDFKNYGLWNQFCPEAEADLTLGSPIKMKVDLGNGLQDQLEYISRIEPHVAIAWAMENKPGDPIHAERTQKLERIDANSCRYVSIDEFSGPAVNDMMQAMAKPVEAGFNLCARCLKDYAERVHAG